MGKSLKLKVKKNSDDILVVSWRDVWYPEFSNRYEKKKRFWLTLWFVASLWILFQFTASDNYQLHGGSLGLAVFLWGAGFIAGMFVLAFLFGRRRMVKNEVKFSHSYVEHANQLFPLEEVTRFEMGTKRDLTGNGPPRGRTMDPYIIRMWLHDNQAHDVSINAWQTQVCHQIRDTLTNALEAVRGKKTDQQNEANFGVVGDNGMPDY